MVDCVNRLVRQFECEGIYDTDSTNQNRMITITYSLSWDCFQITGPGPIYLCTQDKDWMKMIVPMLPTIKKYEVAGI